MTTSAIDKLTCCLEEHSKNGDVKVEENNGKYFLAFDLNIDNSNNQWENLQPKVSVICLKNNFITEYNIRIGEVYTQEDYEDIERIIIESRPPSVDKIDSGHSDEVLQPHIRMTDNSCSVEEFNSFMNRLINRLNRK